MNYKEIEKTAFKMLGEEQIEDAIRFTGEQLALADSEWQRKGRSDVEGLSNLLNIGVLHADCLFRGHYYSDVVSLAVSLLLMASVESPLTDGTFGVTPLALCFLALVGLEAMSEELWDAASAVPDGDEHVRTTISVLASILYYLYDGLRKTGSPWVGRAYELLRPMLGTGIIHSPKIKMLDREIDPASPGDAIGDIIGRLRALGFNFGI